MEMEKQQLDQLILDEMRDFVKNKDPHDKYQDRSFDENDEAVQEIKSLIYQIVMKIPEDQLTKAAIKAMQDVVSQVNVSNANLLFENSRLKEDNENNQELLDECLEWLIRFNSKHPIQNATKLIERLKPTTNEQ